MSKVDRFRAAGDSVYDGGVLYAMIRRGNDPAEAAHAHERAQFVADALNKQSMNQGGRQLADLSSLPPNWDSYGAPPICTNALDLAGKLYDMLQHFLPGLTIVPTTSGGVSLEWAGDGVSLEAEITPDDATDPHVEASQVADVDEQIDRLETTR